MNRVIHTMQNCPGRFDVIPAGVLDSSGNEYLKCSRCGNQIPSPTAEEIATADRKNRGLPEPRVLHRREPGTRG